MKIEIAYTKYRTMNVLRNPGSTVGRAYRNTTNKPAYTNSTRKYCPMPLPSPRNSVIVHPPYSHPPEIKMELLRHGVHPEFYSYSLCPRCLCGWLNLMDQAR